MNYSEFKTYLSAGVNPADYDHYIAGFTTVPENFGDYINQKIPNLTGIWYEKRGQTVYFVIPKGVNLPLENFADSLEFVEYTETVEGSQ